MSDVSIILVVYGLLVVLSWGLMLFYKWHCGQDIDFGDLVFTAAISLVFGFVVSPVMLICLLMDLINWDFLNKALIKGKKL
jgi:hypothetical protein